VEGSCERGNEPSASIKCWETLEYLRFSRRGQLHGVGYFVISWFKLIFVILYCWSTTPF
jgi:hypothetical protein